MTALDEARLRELAEAAKDGGLSSGVWSDDPHTGWITSDADNGYRVHVADVRGWGYLTGQGDVCLKLNEDTAYAIQKRWGAFIAAANPATILALLDALSAERERADRAVGALEMIVDLCPATCETSPAHDMAQHASETLATQSPSRTGEG